MRDERERRIHRANSRQNEAERLRWKDRSFFSDVDVSEYIEGDLGSSPVEVIGGRPVPPRLSEGASIAEVGCGILFRHIAEVLDLLVVIDVPNLRHRLGRGVKRVLAKLRGQMCDVEY